MTQRDRFNIVLVSPRNPLNIGAAARAMANFGFSQLTVVAPYEPHWQEAKSAIGAQKLLQSAKRAERLSEAVADCTLVIGTGTLTYRKPEQRVVPLPALAPLVRNELNHQGRIALVFGPEKHGLTREDLSYCNLLVEIPTDPAQPSMNLGQAAAVCLYELSTRSGSPGETSSHGDLQSHSQAPGSQVPGSQAAGTLSSNLEVLAGLVEETMTAAQYSPASMKNANRHDLRLLLRRLNLNPTDTRRALGYFRRVLRRIKEPKQ